MQIISLFSGYIRNIAIFLIFTAFINLIIPQSKYKEYLNLTLGLILIFIVISPLKAIVGGLDEPFAKLGNRFEQNVMAYDYDKYDDAGRALIIEEYTNRINGQIKDRLGGRYISSSIVADISEESFGTIREICVTASEEETEPISQSVFARIEPVEIESVSVFSSSKKNTAPVEEDEWTKELKNSLSSFYNVPSANIHITIQKK